MSYLEEYRQQWTEAKAKLEQAREQVEVMAERTAMLAGAIQAEERHEQDALQEQESPGDPKPAFAPPAKNGTPPEKVPAAAPEAEKGKVA